MKPILYVKGSTARDVRLNKFLKYFNKSGIRALFFGWKRDKSELDEDWIEKEYIFEGGGVNNRILILYYPLWMIRVFFFFLFKRGVDKYNIILINFDVAFPAYLASLFRKFDFIYEVYDEFAISYRFPSWLKSFIKTIDQRIMMKAKAIIHVDVNRITSNHSKAIVIENTPYDYFESKQRTYEGIKHIFAVTGLLNNQRGIKEILNFAQCNSHVKFLMVGDITDKNQKIKANTLKNVTVTDFMPQNQLFSLMKLCCGIFSLYDPTIEINRLAASNKVYDAMMMGIPVITNKDVVNSSFIRQSEVGYVIDYEFNESWNFLACSSFVAKAVETGKKGRELYLSKYIFNKLIEDRLLTFLEKE